jgi:hypothetical protein
LSSRPQWRDLQFSQPAFDANGSATLAFVIPTAVDLQFSQPAFDADGSAALPFVIRTAVEGPAVL